MDAMTFVAELVKALAWPTAIFSTAFMFREVIRGLAPHVTSVKYGDAEIVFGEQLSALAAAAAKTLPPDKRVSLLNPMREELLQIVPISPKEAVIQAWREIERRLIRVATNHKLLTADTDLRKPLKIVESLHLSAIVDANAVSLIGHLRVLRNEVKHVTGTRVVAEDSIHYIDLAVGICSALDEVIQETINHDKKAP